MNIIIHLLAGFVFVLVDTDGFRPELNPFTGNGFADPKKIWWFYTWGFTVYFLGLAWRFVYPPCLKQMGDRFNSLICRLCRGSLDGKSDSKGSCAGNDYWHV